jgi:hypothetical protein
VIDFVVPRFAGSVVRGIEPFLDRFELQAELSPIAQLVLAHYERLLGGLFEKPRQCGLSA